MLTSVVSVLPAKAQPYAKAIVAAIVAALTIVAAVVDDAPSWLPIVLSVLSAPAVFATPNLDPNAVAQDESTMPPEASGSLAADIHAEVFDALNQPRQGA